MVLFLTFLGFSDATPLGRSAAVVGNGGDVANQRYFETCGLQRAKGALATGAGAFDEHGHRAHPVLHRPASCLFGSELSGERGALARTLETSRPRRRPGDRSAVDVGDGDDGVVEARLDVGDPSRNVLANLLL